MKLPKNFNPLVVACSLVALGFIALIFLVNPYFVVGAVIFMLIGQRELMGKKKDGKK